MPLLNTINNDLTGSVDLIKTIIIMSHLIERFIQRLIVVPNTNADIL